MTRLSNSRLELWGGPECTVNRVGDTYFDQLKRTGHADRLADLDLFADLGFRALRYPVLWERTAPEGVAKAFPAARAFEAYIQPNTGHAINLHYNSTGAYRVMQEFLIAHGLGP